MDTIEVKAFLFLYQQIVWCIYFEANKQGLQPLSLGVIKAVVQFYHQGALGWNYSSCM